MATLESVLATNVAQLRKRRGYSVRGLAGVMAELGRPIDPSGITKLENGTRKPGALDLVALAMALGVSPNRLLLPVDDPRQEIELAPAVATQQSGAWAWADGRSPLMESIKLLHGSETTAIPEWIYDFQRDARPIDEWERERHTAVRACRDVLHWINSIIGDEVNTEADGRAIDPRTKLRGALRRLQAEVDDLIGVDDGER